MSELYHYLNSLRVGMSKTYHYHTLSFSQGSGTSQRYVHFWLTDANTQPEPKTLEGRWRQIHSDPAGIELHPRFTKDDMKRLQWRWDSSKQGGLIQLGIDTPSETVHGRTTKSFFRVWLSFRGAKRLASGQFRVAGYNPEADFYPLAQGVAVFELPGSSNTFQNGEGQWAVVRYDYTA